MRPCKVRASALEQVAQHADENFLKFRRLGDMLGRRSPAEMAELQVITEDWLKDDPLHAGASLLQAYALRSSGRYDECKKLIETLDNNYPLMQSIVSTIYAQIAFLNGSVDETKRMLDKAIAQSQQSGSAEAAIMYGWIMMTEQRWDKARSYAAKARQLQADNVEVAILEGLATAYERPGRSRDGIQALRRGQLNASPDDWHYREALASSIISQAIINSRRERSPLQSPSLPVSSGKNSRANKLKLKTETCPQ